MNRIRYLLLTLLTLLLSPIAAAYCQHAYFFEPRTHNLSFGNVVVPHHLPAGSILREHDFNQMSNSELTIFCYERRMIKWFNSQFLLLPNYHETVYDSTIPGIGIKFILNDNRTLSGALPYYNETAPVCQDNYESVAYCGNVFRTLSVQLIKTDRVTGSGKIPNGQLIEASVHDLKLYRYNLTNTSISTPSCFFTQYDHHVSMGKIQQSQFRGVGSHSPPVPFSFSLQCSSQTALDITFKGKQSISSDNSIIALDEQNNKAQGIGLQILYKGRKVGINQPLQLLPTTHLFQDIVDFSAQYVQYQEQIKSGDANVTVTLAISYP
nr:fimbrial protein [uncultured Moellerella sp.]